MASLFDLFLRRPSKFLLEEPVVDLPVGLQVTLWPSFPHFTRFVKDKRLQGIRMNSAMIKAADLDSEIPKAKAVPGVPLYFDVKGRQLRITEVMPFDSHLEIRINHPIKCATPTSVLFKAGEDAAKLIEVKDGGHHLIFEGGPHYMVYVGESLHIRHPSLEVGGPIFVDAELEKIEKVKAAGFDRWYLSYVEDWEEIDEFQNLVGRDAEIRLKIESKRGLEFTSRFKKRDGLSLVAARGDLYVEVDYPHQIMKACKAIIEKDPEATVGSRMLLSMVNSDCPSCADFSELAWLYDIGYRNFLLCDELCLKEPLLAKAVNAFAAFRGEYCE